MREHVVSWGGYDDNDDREREIQGQSKPKVRWKRNQKDKNDDNYGPRRNGVVY